MRKVLILGATSAIAQESAKIFAAKGDPLFLVGRHEGRLKIICDDLRVRSPAAVHYAVSDLNRLEQHEALIERATETLGGLDTVLIAHGTLSDQAACEQSIQTTEQELRTNLLGPISLLTLIANRFEQQRTGCIVAISSVAGDRGRRSNYVYGTAKGGLTIFLQGLRHRLHAAGVQVLTVKPGFVDTPMTQSFKKGFLWVGPDYIARGIDSAIERGRTTVYLPWFWAAIMAAIKATPERIFCRLAL